MLCEEPYYSIDTFLYFQWRCLEFKFSLPYCNYQIINRKFWEKVRDYLWFMHDKIVSIVDPYIRKKYVTLFKQIKAGEREREREREDLNKAVMKVKTEQGCSHASLTWHCRVYSWFNGGKGIRACSFIEKGGQELSWDHFHKKWK